MRTLAQTHDPFSMIDTLYSWGNETLDTGRTPKIEGDGSWIQDGLMFDSLIVGHDESCMLQMVKDIHYCAAFIYCKITHWYTTCTWAENTTTVGADNYHPEIIGGILAQLMIKTAVGNRRISKSMTVWYQCDNKGVVSRGNLPIRPLKDGQSQDHILRLFCENNPIHLCTMKYDPCLWSLRWSIDSWSVLSGWKNQLHCWYLRHWSLDPRSSL